MHDTDETFVYTATFALTQAAIDAGGISNTAVSTGNPVDASGNDIPGLGDVVDTSDNDAAGDGTDGGPGGTDDDPTVVALAPTPSLELIKSADTSALSTPLAVGNIVTYTFTVENTGNTALAGVAPVDTLTLGTDGTGAAASLTTCLLYTSPSPRDRG